MSRETFIAKIRSNRVRASGYNPHAAWRKPKERKPKPKRPAPSETDERASELSQALSGSKSGAERPVSLPKIHLREIKWDDE